MIVLLALVCGGLWYYFRGADRELYTGEIVSFVIPMDTQVMQYGLRTAIVGREEAGAFLPLVDAVQYREDPQAPVSATYDAFLHAQLFALCGSDAEQVTCTNSAATPYTTSGGVLGQEIVLTLVRTSPSGIQSESTFGPIYAFNQSRAATEHNPRAFKALLIYPSFTTYLKGVPAFDTLDAVMETLVIEDGVSDVVGP